MVRGRPKKKIIPDYYSVAWFKHLKRYRHHNETAILAVLAHLGKPKNGYLDLGCGAGTMLKQVRRAGVRNVAGVEISDAVRTVVAKWLKVYVADLTLPLKVPGTFDLVTCIEVAEHVNPSGTAQFLKNVAEHTNKWLVFTAALPGQGGDGHVNLRHQALWLRDIEQLGLTFDKDKTIQLKETWKWTTGPMFWLPQNLLVFRRD